MMIDLISDCPFNIDDQVISKKTGLPACGRVRAIMPAWFYINQFVPNAELLMHIEDNNQRKIVDKSSNIEYYSRWSTLYSDWMFKYVIIVELKKPQKAATIEEVREIYISYFNKMPDEESLLQYYQEQFPERKYITYPQDDLEKI